MTTPTIDGLTVVGFNPIMLKGDPGAPGALAGYTITGSPTVGQVLTATASNAATWATPTAAVTVADGGNASSTSTTVYDGGHA